MRTYPVNEEALRMRRWRHVLEAGSATQRRQGACLPCWLRPRALAGSEWCSGGCLNLGELNTTQIDRWQRSIEVIEEDGQASPASAFRAIGRAGLRSRRRMFAKWRSQAWRCVGRAHWATAGWDAGLWEELGLDTFWFQALGDRRGAVEWSKVMELLAVNRLCAPSSELSIHERSVFAHGDGFPFGLR